MQYDIKLEIESRMKNGFSHVFPNGRYFEWGYL